MSPIPTQPTNPAQAVEPAQVVELVQAANPAQAVELVQAVEPAQPVLPVELMQGFPGLPGFPVVFDYHEVLKNLEGYMRKHAGMKWA